MAATTQNSAATPSNNTNNLNNNTDFQNNNNYTDRFGYSSLRISQLTVQETANFVPFKLKLNTSNYLVWKDQISSILIATDLFGFIDGSIPPEPPSILQNNVAQPNPAYLQWIQMDHFVSSCINATILPSLATKLLNKKTAREKWLHLAKIYSEHCVAVKPMLRAQLHSIRRRGAAGASTAVEFLHQLKSVANSLAEIGEAVPDSDLVIDTLNGLGRDYEGFVIAIQLRETPITFSELCAKLINHEQLMKARKERQRESISSARVGSGSGSGFGTFPGGGFQKTAFSPHQNQVVDYTAITCQICYEVGHSAVRCRFRYDASYNNAAPKHNKCRLNFGH